MNMKRTLNVKQLRASLPSVIRHVQAGDRLTVYYRSRPAFRIVPVDDSEGATATPLADDPIFEAEALGRSKDGLSSADHDRLLYGPRKP